ncbi:efflux RND transporter periplasmic adaptor subunit [Sphingobacterium sp.]|uniref:efflux RND transporter periplasmic adaptor subunit n=1 Tax=Sphingobacterium sp. TaxID=341027 RepID=UPI0028A6B44D|nr:efflux RND transporter periplasmic adaptor subunit [Sphingobacterium sp.]
MKNIKSLPLGLITLIACCTGCGSSQQQQIDVQDSTKGFCISDQLKKTTEIITVKESPIVEQLTLSGKIEYNENDLVTFRSLLLGVVDRVDFELGDQVKKGQVLATIKSTEIQSLFQQKNAQQNQINLLAKLLVTKKDLLKDGMISEPEMLQVEHELESAKIELKRINQSLQLYHAVGEGTFQILAPKNGYIIQKDISQGQIITQESNPLFSISNLKEVWVMLNVYASNLRFIKTGDQVKVRTIAYPDQVYTGKIDKIYNVFDANEHVMKARVVLENQNLNLMPGLSADIIIDKIKSEETALAIPNKSLVFSNNENFMVVYKGDCQLEAKKLAIISSNEEVTYVSNKLEANEKVIGSNALLIFEQIKGL